MANGKLNKQISNLYEWRAGYGELKFNRAHTPNISRISHYITRFQQHPNKELNQIKYNDGVK